MKEFNFSYCESKSEVVGWLQRNHKLLNVVAITRMDDEWIIFFSEESQPKEPTFTIQDLLNFADYCVSGSLSGKWSSPFKGNVEIAREYFLEKHNITIP